MNNIAFHFTQKCPGVDAKSYGHYGRVHHTSFSCPALPLPEVWVPHRPKAFLYGSNSLKSPKHTGPLSLLLEEQASLFRDTLGETTGKNQFSKFKSFFHLEPLRNTKKQRITSNYIPSY